MREQKSVGSRRSSATILAAIIAIAVLPATILAEDDGVRNPLKKAWKGIAATMKPQWKTLKRPGAPRNEIELAEGTRYLTRLLSFSIQRAIEFDDPEFPLLHNTPGPLTKWGLENPDNRYLTARISGDATYRLTGRLGTSNQLIIQVVEGEFYEGRGEVVASIIKPDILCDTDGNFEITLSPDPGSGNWLQLTPASSRVTIREIFSDWELEQKGEMRIVKVGNEGLAPPVLDEAQMVARLREASAQLEQQVSFWVSFTDGLRALLPPNFLPPPRGSIGAPDATLFASAKLELEPGQGLLIEGTIPDATYWSFALVSFHGTTLDFANHQSSINHAQAFIDSDGGFRAVVAAEDPGVPNWLDTVGHREGFVVARYTAAVAVPELTSRVVSLDTVRDHLPPDHPIVTEEERRAEIEIRQRHVSHRYDQ